MGNDNDEHRESGELNRIVAEYVERLNAGERLEPSEVLLCHPRRGEEILAQLELFVGAASIGHDRDSEALGTLGDYTLRRQIGRGGMGVVYEAWENSLDRRVALKVLPPGVAADERALQRFVREAKTAGQLNHANVVSVYSTGVREGTPWYSMEYVEGETLAQMLVRLKDAPLEEKTPFGPPRDDVAYYTALARAFAAVAEGLQHAHSMGVIHRDIKPSNLILDGEGRFRILDFGLARLEGQESLTLSGDFVGTPLYMSPEQAKRKKIPVDHRTDIYSLGATMYEAICGWPPFRGKDHADTLSQIIERDPVEPRKVNARVPEDLEIIVLKCMWKDAGDRYGTAEALGQDLRRFVRGDPIEARPQSGWEKLARRLRRNAGKILVAASVVVVLLALGWLAWEQQIAEREARRLLHDEVVRDAARDLYRGQLIFFGKDLGSLDDLVVFRALEFKRGVPAIEGSLSPLAEIADAMSEVPDAPYYLALMYRLAGDGDAASREAARALERDPDFVPAQVLFEEVVGGMLPLEESALETMLSRYRDEDGWQEPWLLAYKHGLDGNWAEAADAYGRLLTFYEKKGEPYIGFAVEALMGRGLACLQARDFWGAIRAFAGAQAIWPQFSDAGLFLGKALYDKGEHEETERVFRDLYTACPQETRRELALWITVFYMGTAETEKVRQWRERTPESERQRLKGCHLYYQCRYAEAVEVLREPLKRRPDDLVALLVLGYSRLAMQWHRFGPDWDEERREILELASRTNKLHPNQPLVRGLLAMALQVNGLRDEAVRMAESTIELQRRLREEPVGGSLILGPILKMQGKHERAEKTLRGMLEHQPNNPLLRFELALVLEDAERYEEAIAEHRAVISAGSHGRAAYSQLAGVLNRLGRHEEAVENAKVALAGFPRNTSAYENLAFALWRLGKTDEALETTRAGMEELPGRVRIHVVRGWILEDLGKSEQAAGSFREALRLHPEDPEARDGLRRVSERNKDVSGRDQSAISDPGKPRGAKN